MFKEFLLLLLFAHIWGDFYLQTNTMAEKKKRRFSWVLLHSLCYWLVLLAVLLPVMTKQVLLFGCIAAASHMLIDILKYLCVSIQTKKKPLGPNRERNVFFADQTAHLLSMTLISCLFAMGGNLLYVHGNITPLLQTMGISAKSLLSWAVALSLLHKPANIAISRLLTLYKPDSKDDRAEDKNAGRFIGTLERAIIIVLISLGQYAAIGLVLTAKSIARYDKIAKDTAFAEYYLLGTLLSTLAVIVISFIL